MERIRVILVDNDPDELYFMEKGFESSDLYTIVAQCSGWQELISVLQSRIELPDLIITDLNMPGKSGIDIAATLARSPTFNSINVVVLSIMSGGSNGNVHTALTKTSRLLPKPSSLLEYESFAIDLYDKIHADLFK